MTNSKNDEVQKPKRGAKPMEADPGEYPFSAGEGNLGKFRQKSKRINAELGKYSLTEKQAKVLGFVTDHIDQVGFPPTVRQIANYFGISAKAAHDHLRAISKKGYIRLFPGSARGMELVRQSEFNEPKEKDVSQTPVASLMSDVVVVPLVGSIAAGSPILAEENIESKLTFPRSFLSKTGNLFALHVRGDSMQEAGILDGDVAILEQLSDPMGALNNGDIVAAIIDGEATLKTFNKKRSTIELVPENKKYSVITLKAKDNPSIAGRLVGVYRRY